MKITLDHNCLINCERGGETADLIRATIANDQHQCFVVNVGASEMQRFGVRPDNYGAFEKLLVDIGLAHLPRLDPIGIWDVTFWDHSLCAGDADKTPLTSIQTALFPIDGSTTDESKLLNRLCDALTMWCHISYKNDVFMTSDANFSKATKLPKLLELGAGRVCAPGEV